MTPKPPPLVSIVTPTFNQSRYVRETIESVLCQDYPNIEYIVIDDGSTDDTQDVLAEYQGRLICHHQANMGQARTLNRGWSEAKGEYLAYLSSDDTLAPHAISKLVAALEASPSAACVFPDADLIDDESRIVKRNVCRAFSLEDLIVKQECYIGPGALFRASAYHKAGGWRSELKLAPDREFWMRLAATGHIIFLPQALAGYRLHPESISYKEVSEHVSREYLLVLDRFFASPDVPPEIMARRDESYGYANLLIARNLYRAMNIRKANEYYQAACLKYPPLNSWRVRLTILKNIVGKPLRLLYGNVQRLLS